MTIENDLGYHPKFWYQRQKNQNQNNICSHLTFWDQLQFFLD